jgi:hypothetical protein
LAKFIGIDRFPVLEALTVNGSDDYMVFVAANSQCLWKGEVAHGHAQGKP